MKFTKKFWIISAVAIVVLGIAGKWYGGRETLDEVDVEQATVRDIVERVSASGKSYTRHSHGDLPESQQNTALLQIATKLQLSSSEHSTLHFFVVVAILLVLKTII